MIFLKALLLLLWLLLYIDLEQQQHTIRLKYKYINFAWTGRKTKHQFNCEWNLLRTIVLFVLCIDQLRIVILAFCGKRENENIINSLLFFIVFLWHNEIKIWLIEINKKKCGTNCPKTQTWDLRWIWFDLYTWL